MNYQRRYTLIKLFLFLLVLGLFLLLGTRYSSEPLSPSDELLQPLVSLQGTYIQRNTLASISSPLSNNETILWEMADKYGYNYDTLDKLWACESQRRHDNVWGDNYMSYGGFQWQFGSWELYTRIFDLRELNILSFRDQAKLTILVLQRGDNWNWRNCWTQIQNI